MGEIRRTLIPQFSTRWVLAATAVLAVVSMVIAYAVRGQAWAVGVTAAVVVAAAAMLAYAVSFCAAALVVRWVDAFMARRRSRQTPASAAAKTTAVLLALVALTLAPHRALAAAGLSHTLPTLGPGQVNRSGLTLTLDTTWVDTQTYRPIRVKINSIAGPLPADRALTLQLTFIGYAPFAGKRSVVQTVELPAGSTGVDATVLTPSGFAWGSFGLDVFENGFIVEQLSVPQNTLWLNANTGRNHVPNALLLSGGGTLTPMRAFEQEFGANATLHVGPSVAAPGIGTPGTTGTTAIPSLADLPTKWIAYTGVDVVISSLDELKKLAQKHPQQWQAIRLWNRNGGSLVIYGIGQDWRSLAELETFLGDTIAGDADDPLKRGWQLPRERDHIVSVLHSEGTGSVEYRHADGSPVDASLGRPPIVRDEDEADSPPADYVPLERAPFLKRAAGRGVLLAVAADEGSMGTDFPWLWLFNTIGQQRWEWEQRFGVSSSEENPDFWNFLIPGVGLAPVFQFQVLISLFVVAIGPVNYILLRRRSRLNLMVLTVPTAALLITGALVLYAFAADGLSVRLRARSITLLDQQAGEANCWARLSYYAGMAPGGGLTFSDQTAVVLLEPAADNQSSGQLGDRVLDWVPVDPSRPESPMLQQMSKGWLRGRTPTQFVTARIRPTEARLEVTPSESGTPPQVKNRLGTAVQQLILVDETGACYSGGATADEAAVQLTKEDSQAEAFRKHLQSLLQDNRPRQPDFGQGINSRFSPYGNQPYRGASYSAYSDQPPRQDTGILERSIAEATASLEKNQLPPRSYVAVVDSSPEFERGTSKAREEASLHIVVGKW